ncbi:MAG: NADH-quinone oxidoreductase subunit H [Proteobacteria bacterium]|nr:NADH-quinone oxidoreductase subunit H [Pseudomonadota bacterium]MBU4296546.1 NADH-quinone oxidoreductase subunit H [Pseudomonadota bacterium]MCG2748799.1 NADH-quinone oxidoreductase subunit H [Desulfobulbaceae bacterium]
MESIVSFCFAILAAPLLSAIIMKVKAYIAGRKGPPILIKYYTLAKLFKKGSVYSTSSSFVFKLGPVVSFCSVLMVLLFFPFAGIKPLLSFHGDVIILLYLMGLGRFFTIIAALDTASPFEGMGAAREAYFSTLAEATLFVILLLFFRLNGAFSFAAFFTGPTAINLWSPAASLLLLVIVALFVVLLTENSRVPVDDPATHLELTMIHEVMILDHSGPDLALIELGAYLKLFFYSAFITCLLYPFQLDNVYLNGLIFYGIMGLIYVLVGITESIMARYKMNLVPKFILTSFALVFFATILTMEFVQ